MSRSRTPLRMWGVPILLGCLSILGLVAALLADGPGDAVSWLTLALPVVVAVCCAVRRA